MTSHVKCANCNIYSKDTDVCSNCNKPLFSKHHHQLRLIKEEEARRKKERIKKDASPSFYEKNKAHRFFIVRVFVKILHSIWLVFMAIGMFIAWLISTIVA
ncbi:MAG: hypothetical protein ACPGUH_07855 [Winogradskyella sp.]